MSRSRSPEHPGESVKSGNVMDHNHSCPACNNYSVILPSKLPNVRYSFTFSVKLPIKLSPTRNPNTNLKCGCHNAHMVYCSRAQFSIDLLYIAIRESWIKMVWFQLGSRNITGEIIIAGVWFQPAVVFMSQCRYIHAFKSHASAETFHVYTYLKCQ